MTEPVDQVSGEPLGEDLDEALSPTRVQAMADRLAGWGGRLASPLAWFAVAGWAAAAAAAWRALPVVAAVVVTVVVSAPMIGALVLRARLVWLVAALPAALGELRSLASVRQAQTEDDDPDIRDLRVRVRALQRELVGSKRRSLLTLIRVIKLVRSPANQALQLARGSVSSVERVQTTAQVVDHSAGLPALAIGATAGSALVWLVAVILFVVGSF